jgi:predicted TIM-barrel fold metal-dependent hydrolase
MNAEPQPLPDCDPPPRSPARAVRGLPAGACDSHLHVFGPHARYRLDARRNYTPHECSLDDYRQVMRTTGIERAVLVQPSVYGTDNSAMLDALREGGPAFRAVAVPAPDSTDAALRDMHVLGVRGIRLNLLNPQVVGIDQALALLERTKGLGFAWHLQVLADLARDPRALLSLCDKTDAAIVVDHMGKLPPAARTHPLFDLLRAGRCWVKLSAPYRVSVEPSPYRDIAGLARALAEANPARALWGSDWPHTELRDGTPEAALLVDLLHGWFPGPTALEQVCVTNPARLYGFPLETTS